MEVQSQKELEALTGLKVKVGNDANVAALGEMWKGGGSGEKNMVMVTLGTGVGDSVIINGRSPHRCTRGRREIGHICVNYSETETCGCGKRDVWNSMLLQRASCVWQNKS